MADKHPDMSDTFTVTSNGQVVVDMQKVFAKPHIQQMLREMRAKVRRVPKGSGASLIFASKEKP